MSCFVALTGLGSAGDRADKGFFSEIHIVFCGVAGALYTISMIFGLGKNKKQEQIKNQKDGDAADKQNMEEGAATPEQEDQSS